MGRGEVSWSTPKQLAAQVERRWKRGEILRSRLTGAPLFPLQLKLCRPRPKELTEQFDEVRRWVQNLRSHDRSALGFGYDLVWKDVNHRVHGRNQTPVGAIVPTEQDALRMISMQKAAQRFSSLTDATLALFPALLDWLAHHPLRVLDNAADWPSVLAVLQHFAAHPRPGLYLRQLDIQGVDTKFIERRRRLLAELLDVVLPPEAVDTEATGHRNFNRRYGLRDEPRLIRFRTLDPQVSLQGLTDLSVTAEEFATLRLPISTVFITENKVNGLAFPMVPGAIVIFGLGYGLDRLAEATWLQALDLFYWGDIDTHGFAILDRLRAHLRNARALLMDRQTLMAHRALWVEEPAGDRCVEPLTRLTPAEHDLYRELQDGSLGLAPRLEQERIAFGWLDRALARLRS